VKKLAIVLGVAFALVVAVLAIRAPAPAPVTSAQAAEATTPVVIAPVTTATAPTPVTAPTTVASTAAPPYDPFAHRAEIEAALARNDVTALPALQQIDLTRDGYVAAAAIDAVGKLAALAPNKEKRDAVATLARWLQQESKRKESDARGNVSILVDALEDTKSPDAIAPLVAALDSATHPLHVETRIVEALKSLGDKSGAIQRFAKRVAAMQPQDDFEKALVAEALEAAK
jgi:hypothetical protein